MTKIIKNNGNIVKGLLKQLNSVELLECGRVSQENFTRNSKLPFPKLVLFLMAFNRRSLQVELTRFMRSLSDGFVNVTKNAVVMSRKKLKAETFTLLLDGLIKDFYTDNDARVKLWKTKRLLAIDGSVYTLPVKKELFDIYGGQDNQYETMVVNGRGSILYDVLNELTIHGELCPYKTSERLMAIRHLTKCGEGDLVIFDRGYPSIQMMNQVLVAGADYLMRCKKKFNSYVIDFVESQSWDTTIEMTKEGEAPLMVRMVKVLLDTGEQEILLTSLLDTELYPLEDFKNLYFKRWGIEQFYNVFKNILGVEEFTGHSPHVIQQDFHSALLMCNIHSLIVSEAEDKLPAKDAGLKYERKINKNVTFGILKDQMVELLLSKDYHKALIGLEKLFLSNTIPIRPGRSNPRDTKKYKLKPKPPYAPNAKRAT